MVVTDIHSSTENCDYRRCATSSSGGRWYLHYLLQAVGDGIYIINVPKTQEKKIKTYFHDKSWAAAAEATSHALYVTFMNTINAAKRNAKNQDQVENMHAANYSLA